MWPVSVPGSRTVVYERHAPLFLVSFAAGLVAVFPAVAAERRRLEDVAHPLAVVRRRVAAAMRAAAR
jgi:hypothetical protein